MKKLGFIFLAVLVITGCSFGQSSGNTMLWRISKPGISKPSYLFGTMHVAMKTFMLFTDSVYNAIAETDGFFGELDYDNGFSIFTDTATIEFLRSKTVFIDSVIRTPGWKSMVDRLNRRYGTKVHPDSLDQFMDFNSKKLTEVYVEDKGVKVMDIMLWDYAKSLGKKTGGLETYLLQIDMLYKIVGVRAQDTTLNFDDEEALITNFKRYYLNQRLDSIDNYLQLVNVNYRNIIFTNRNKTMADSIAMQMERSTAFFAVGCGHLPGNDGVIELLREKGYEVSPVYSDNKISLLLLNKLKDKWKAGDNNDAPKEMSPAGFDTLTKHLNEMGIPGSKTKAEVIDANITLLPSGKPPPPPPPSFRKKKNKTLVKAGTIKQN